MPLTRWMIAGVLALLAVLGLSGYELIRLVNDSRGESQSADAAASLRLAHKRLSDRLDLIPLVTAPGEDQDVINGLRDFCAVYRYESASLLQAGKRLAGVRARLARATGILANSCQASSTLMAAAGADPSRTGLDFRTTNRQAIMDIQTALLESGRSPSEELTNNNWPRVLELLALMALSGCALAYLMRKDRDGARTPVTATAGPALASQWMRTAMETSSEGILIVEPEGVIRSANAAAEKILGFERGGLAGMEASRITPSLAASTDSYGVLEQVTVKNEEGVENVCQVSWFRRKGAANAPTVVFVQSAPTVDMAAGAAPKRRPAQTPAPGPIDLDADSLGRLEDEILLVAGFGEMALAGLPPDSPSRQDLEQLTRAAARAVVLCREAAPAGALGMPSQRLGLNAFIADFERRLLALLEPGVDLMVRTDVAAGSVGVDPALLEQAMLSLTLRALALVPEARLIRLATAPGRIDAAVQTRGVSSPGWRRVLGNQNLPRAAAWLAAQGATLEQDVADNDGGFRFRIHLSPVAEQQDRMPESAADVA